MIDVHGGGALTAEPYEKSPANRKIASGLVTAIRSGAEPTISALEAADLLTQGYLIYSLEIWTTNESPISDGYYAEVLLKVIGFGIAENLNISLGPAKTTQWDKIQTLQQLQVPSSDEVLATEFGTIRFRARIGPRYHDRLLKVQVFPQQGKSLKMKFRFE
ncbi:MAG: hypothetical protein DWQ01_06835 [Planctomycetota bacterium]|nr:MAG: hypothetical protein DWQ01_06835 [Planctomycetota bacterium]